MKNLNSWEMEALISLCVRHWQPEDRQRIARALPEVYAKLTDTRVVADTEGTLVITAKK